MKEEKTDNIVVEVYNVNQVRGVFDYLGVCSHVETYIPEYPYCIRLTKGRKNTSPKSAYLATNREIIPFEVFKSKYLSTEETYIPKVGDWVVLTKGHRNWDSNMKKLVGNIVQVTGLIPNSSSKHEIDFQGRKWQYTLEDGHFRKARPEEIPNQKPATNEEEIFTGIYRGDIVVSLREYFGRGVGEMFKVLEESMLGVLYYREDTNSINASTWRKATPYETEHYKNGIRYIDFIHDKKPTTVETVVDSKLEEAKRRYPKGTKFKSPYSGAVVTSSERVESDRVGIICQVEEFGNYYIYYNGKWAEVVDGNIAVGIDSADKPTTGSESQALGIDTELFRPIRWSFVKEHLNRVKVGHPKSTKLRHQTPIIIRRTDNKRKLILL